MMVEASEENHSAITRFNKCSLLPLRPAGKRDVSTEFILSAAEWAQHDSVR